MEPKAPFTFYSIAGDSFPETEIAIEKHIVDQEDVDEYREESDEEDDYTLATRIMYDDIVSSYEVNFTPCLIVNEQQFLAIQKFKIE